jgi:hypothetical protein
MTYYTASAFSGDIPLRMRAFRKARELFERGAPKLDDCMEKVALEIAGEEVEGYAR